MRERCIRLPMRCFQKHLIILISEWHYYMHALFVSVVVIMLPNDKDVLQPLSVKL